MLKTIAISIFFIVISAIVSPAQTVAEIESKYGKPTQIYEVRPGIMMTVKFDADGQASEIKIARQAITDSTIYLDVLLSHDLVKEIVDELVPISVRGKMDREGDTFLAGGVATRTDDYGNVTITYHSSFSFNSTCNGLVAVTIKWNSHTPSKKASKNERPIRY